MLHRNLMGSFLLHINDVYTNGDTVNPRGMETKELLNQTITITNPYEHCMFIPGRNDNVFGKIAETLWTLAGRDDLDWLEYYVPRAKEFSDNGKTWRAAYGPRLRNWRGVDQLKNVMDLLKKDTESRRAVISLWDPYEDMVDSKDVPCNNWAHFYIRQGKLHLNIAQRSSDIVWGYSGIDVFFWSVVQDAMAHWLGVEVGNLTHFISSLHLYKRHYALAEKLEYFVDPYIEDIIIPTRVDFSWGDLSYVDDIMNKFPGTTEWFGNCGDFLTQCFHMLQLWDRLKCNVSLSDLENYINHNFPAKSDFKVAAWEYIHR